MTSGIGSLSLQGMQWYAKEELTHFLDSFPTPIILFDNLRDLHFPPVFYEYIDETSPPMSLSKLLTLKTITFVIGSMTASVSRNWSGFFTWLLNVFSGPHSLEKAIFEVSLQEYVPVDDLMMSMDVLDGGSASIPELTFVLVMSGNDWMEERRCKAFIGWLKRELPTLVAAGKLVIVWRWPQEGIWSW
ncbi:hypothetical protein DL96DRAFT_1607704 [Flagelloscypha sp. PMI_526]|nr:hypothetical protein DL96DRAFT_1607704 [Flagelloscypha sp. PMI_526]